MQPRRMPTTSSTGIAPSAATRSACSIPAASGAHQPPTPSTTTQSERAANAACAASSGGSDTETPASSAAIAGAVGSGRANGGPEEHTSELQSLLRISYDV